MRNSLVTPANVLFLTILASLLGATPARAGHFRYLHVNGPNATTGVQAAAGAAPLSIPGIFSGNAFLNTASNVAAGVQLSGLPTMNVVAACTGDFNGDGIPDIIVGSNDRDPSQPGSPIVATITIVRGVGDGTFSAPDLYRSNNSSVISVACGDVNGDGVTDVAVLGSAPDPGNPGSQLGGVLLYTGQSLMNTALGSSVPSQADFDLPSSLAGFDDQPVSLQFGELDGDGIPDLVVSARHPVSDGLSVTTFLSQGVPLNDASLSAAASGITGQIQRDSNGAIHGLRTLAVGSSNLFGAPLSLGRKDFFDVFVATSVGIEVLANDGSGGLSESNPGGGVIQPGGLNWAVAYNSVFNSQIGAAGDNGGVGQLSVVTPADTTLGSGYHPLSALPFAMQTPDDLSLDDQGYFYESFLAGSGAPNGIVVTLTQNSQGSWVVGRTLALPQQPIFTPTSVMTAIHDVTDSAVNDVDVVEASDPSTGNPGGVVSFFPSSSAGYSTIPIPSGAKTTTSFALSTGFSGQSPVAG
jgi:hypothetical protein